MIEYNQNFRNTLNRYVSLRWLFGLLYIRFSDIWHMGD